MSGRRMGHSFGGRGGAVCGSVGYACFRRMPKDPLIADDMHDDLSPMRPPAMLEKVNALPRTKQHPAAADGDRQRRLRQSAFDMCRHVVGPFRPVHEERIAIWDEPLEEGE